MKDALEKLKTVALNVFICPMIDCENPRVEYKIDEEECDNPFIKNKLISNIVDLLGDKNKPKCSIHPYMECVESCNACGIDGLCAIWCSPKLIFYNFSTPSTLLEPFQPTTTLLQFLHHCLN